MSMSAAAGTQPRRPAARQACILTTLRLLGRGDVGSWAWSARDWDSRMVSANEYTCRVSRTEACTAIGVGDLLMGSFPRVAARVWMYFGLALVALTAAPSIAAAAPAAPTI